MKKINFRHLEVQTSFDGQTQVCDIAHDIGNLMMYNGSVLLDIGFEDLAKEIYYSEGEVDIPDQYAKAIAQVVSESKLLATIKRQLIHTLIK
jgi:hypothetical protein